MGIFLFDRKGQISAFEEKPDATRLAQIGRSIPDGSAFSGHSDEKPFVASMGIYVFSRDVLFDILARANATDFGREIIPAALGTHRVNAYLYNGYWADVGTVESFYDANMMLTRDHPPFRFYDAKKPIFTRPRFLPASRFIDSSVSYSMVAEGCYINRCRVETSIVGIRTRIDERATVRRSVLLGADYYDVDEDSNRDRPMPIGVGMDSVLDKVIVDKNARIGSGVRLVNERGVQEADGENYYIRSGIIIVPKGAVVPDGTIV
jgi:glucose-1-phosphate adenylyltransferase